MAIRAVPDIPRLHTTPLASVQIADSQVIVELDDEHEKRFRLVFRPYQAMRMITADCYAVPNGVALLPNTVMEVLDSDWLVELTNSLRQIDATARFMDKGRHFILPLQDDFLEVAAWEVTMSAPEP